MRWARTITDEDVIDRVRRFERSRQKIALFLIVVGLLSMSIGVGGVLWIQRMWQSVEAELSAPPTVPPYDAGLDKMTFFVGVSAGSGCALSFISGVMTIIHGLFIALRRDRRNELLLEFWDQKKAQA